MPISRPGTASDFRRGLQWAAGFAVIALLAFLVWQLSDILLLVFAAVVFATVLRGLARLIGHIPSLKPPLTIWLALLLVVLIVAGFVYVLGDQIVAQWQTIAEQLPAAIDNVGKSLGVADNNWFRSMITSGIEGGGALSTFLNYSQTVLGSLASAVLTIAAGVYLSLAPERYVRGALLLVPERHRPPLEEALGHSGRALELWLLGQLVSMLLIGILTGVGLLLIGMPSALALGFLAGVLEFIPIAGPFLSAVPAVLIALSEGGSMIFWVIGLYVFVQESEGHLIVPLIQRRAVNLPPVLTLFALVAFGVLFGPLGVLLATPLTVVSFVLIKELYLRRLLDEKVEVPGEED